MNHRTDPRTMEARWRALGFEVGWSDTVRAYVVQEIAHGAKPLPIFRTVDEVEAYVVAHAEVTE